MTIIELRLFYEALPDNYLAKGNKDPNGLPTKKRFAEEVGLKPDFINRMVHQKEAFGKTSIDKLLPIMRKYGFPG